MKETTKGDIKALTSDEFDLNKSYEFNHDALGLFHAKVIELWGKNELLVQFTDEDYIPEGKMLGSKSLIRLELISSYQILR